MNDRKLPLYTGPDNNQVRAAKIEKLNLHHGGSATITPEGNGYHFVVSAFYVFGCAPEVGGYFIDHPSGRQSYLAADKFEAEYTLAEQDA